MTKRLLLVALAVAAPLLAAAGERTEHKSVVEWRPALGPVDLPPLPDSQDSDNVQGLTVHEWGTFTSVAGREGTAVEWMPAGGPTDLPCFVNLSGAGAKGLTPAAQGGRTNRATVRMETPVLYFYAPHEETVNVKVRFPRGLITEWYPAATLQDQWDVIRSFPNGTSTIEWKNVRVKPGATANYPIDERQSHYYAARRTASAPLEAPPQSDSFARPVPSQFEKFLFYRGIAGFAPPLSARVLSNGKIEVASLVDEAIPNIVLFENRGGKIGYRIAVGLSAQALLLDPLQLNGSFASLQQDLERILREHGMYALEARAMVDTWKDSWFEPGTRIFYIVPGKALDSILPLEVNPKPIRVARAFVGRMELITPATQEEVRTAIVNHDKSTLEVYGRFLEPILNDFLKDRISEEDRSRAQNVMATIRAAYVDEVTACSKKQSW
jgi:hypothetical protein